ncbi:MAG TPA: hypothetical protein PKD78_07395 [Saprospiraceae bacterium]|nr:hypothetical protein [Saprospiraceae bacterium]
MHLKKIMLPALLWLAGTFVHAQTTPECGDANTPTGNPGPPTIAPIPDDLPLIPPSTSPTAGKRIVYYLHGLGGNEGSWSVAGAEMMKNFPNALSRFPDYSEFLNNSLPSAALVVRNNSNYRGLLAANEGANATFNIDPESNYVIGSSLGAVVAREMDRQFGESGDPYRMGGFVGFGGSNLGAGIVNGKEDLKKMAIGACESLLPGPALDKLPPFWINLLGIGEKVTDITDRFCVIATGVLTSTLLGQFDQAIAEDIAEGSPYLHDLNAYLSDKPKVAFYGIEDEPVFWRTMQFSGVFGVGANSFPPWGAYNDQRLWDDVQMAHARYEEKYRDYWHKYEWHKSRGHNRKAWGYRDKAIAWGCGAYWWETSNDQFKTAIRLRELGTITEIKYGCLCTGGGPPIKTIGSCPPTPPGYNCMQLNMAFEVPVWIDHPNDGIVRASSAKFLPNATHGPVLMPGSNHFSNRNDPNTKDCLFGLYDGIYGLYFKIE